MLRADGGAPFGMRIGPAAVLIVVLSHPMPATVPETSPAWIVSPTVKGLVRKISKPVVCGK